MTGAIRPCPAAQTPAWRTIPQPLLLQLALLICVVAVFSPVWWAGFLNYDDNVNVYKHYRITDFSLDHLRYFWSGPHGNLYIPLTYTLWGLLAKLSALLPATDNAGLHPALFHGTNFMLHAGSVLALFHLLRRLLKNDWGAAAGALLFAVHPVQVEAVAWVTGLKDTLCGFFSMLALWQYLSSATASPYGLPWRDKRYLLATLFLSLALLAKPGAVTVPLAAALLVTFHAPRKARQLILELGPWLLLCLPVVLVTRFAQPATQHDYLPALWPRALVAGDAITFYLGKLLLPLTLGPDYGRTPQYVLAQGWVYATGLLPYLLALLLVWQYRKPWAITAALAFLAPLLPVLGLTPFDFQMFSTVADRYLYLAMLGPALGLGWLAAQHHQRQAVRCVLIGLLVLLSAKSAAQVRIWQTPLRFNSHMVQVNPQSAAGHTNLGVNLKEANRIPEAIDSFRRAIALAPDSSHALLANLNLGQIHEMQARPQEAEAFYRRAMEINPMYATAYADYCASQGDQARAAGDLARALRYYQKVLTGRSDAAKDYANLGLVYKDLNNRDEAIAAYLKAIALQADFAEIYNNLGLIYEATDTEKAIRLYQKALAIKPSLGEAANNLGLLYLGLHRELEAIPLFHRAISAYPNHPMPYNNLGMAHANLGQLTIAAEHFQKAIALESDFAPAVNNLEKIEQQLDNHQDL